MFRKTSQPKTARQTNIRRFSLEALENRQLMAGDVSVSVVLDNLVVTGDNNANQIEIHQSTGNLYKVSGLNGTKINGQADRTFRVTQGMKIDLGGGDDTLTMGGTVFFDDVDGILDINMGAGKDKVNLGKVDILGFTSIKTGTEADIVNITLGGVYHSTLSINTDAGDDKVVVAATVGTNLNVDTLAGQDQVDFTFSTFSGVTDIRTGTENDQVNVNQVASTGGLKVNTAGGSDAVNLKNLVKAALIDIRTGTEADAVDFTNVVANGAATVDTSSGDDAVNVTGSTFDKLLDVRTFAGNDTVNVSQVTAKAGLKIDTNAGNDNVTLTGVNAQGKNIDVLTGDDDDVVKLNQVVADQFFADLAGGDDRIDIQNSTFRLTKLFGGAGGNDDFFDLGGNNLGTLTLDSIQQQ